MLEATHFLPRTTARAVVAGPVASARTARRVMAAMVEQAHRPRSRARLSRMRAVVVGAFSSAARRVAPDKRVAVMVASTQTVQRPRRTPEAVVAAVDTLQRLVETVAPAL